MIQSIFVSEIFQPTWAWSLFSSASHLSCFRFKSCLRANRKQKLGNNKLKKNVNKQTNKEKNECASKRKKNYFVIGVWLTSFGSQENITEKVYKICKLQVPKIELTSRSCVIASFWSTIVVCLREVAEILFSSSLTCSAYSFLRT